MLKQKNRITRLCGLFILSLVITGCGPSEPANSQPTNENAPSASDPAPADIEAAFRAQMTKSRKIQSERIGLPIGAKITWDDLLVVRQQCYKSFNSKESPQDYMCAIAWAFKGGSQTPVDTFRMWKNELGDWNMKPLAFDEQRKVLETVGWSLN
ncbi:hypothetical protein [Rhizobium sp. PP-CC-3G-465]|uniref:hypothetical protein n=1 Tax=Rhizobium sp. PP-CC-3G-465 TaxID=2135648 RepID=UPI00104FC0F6